MRVQANHTRADMSKEDNKFPVLGSGVLPVNHVQWDKLNDQWAQRIHGQTLERLAQRGGLSDSEIYLNLNRLKWGTKVTQDQATSAVNSIAWKEVP